MESRHDEDDAGVTASPAGAALPLYAAPSSMVEDEKEDNGRDRLLSGLCSVVVRKYPCDGKENLRMVKTVAQA